MTTETAIPTIVYGPMACGKTCNAEALRILTGCDRVVDDWDGYRPLPEGNVLVLTYLTGADIKRRARGRHRAIPFESFDRGALRRTPAAEAVDDRIPIAATDNRDVDWVDVTGWGVFKGHAIPVDVARFIAEKINLYHAQRDHPVTTQATHRHKRRGTEYVLIGIGGMQSEDWRDPSRPADNCPNGVSVNMRQVAIYRSVDDGSLWVRPREEFEDGRFKAVAAADAVKATPAAPDPAIFDDAEGRN
ncbi:hypothetical protein [Mesorhizobium sp. CAU 1732]|uniref:hypothetical protein n=1 Tax=Mesorhizobium sp. CAU 1732 TaxID=3140358 RepID=UPI0032614729